MPITAGVTITITRGGALDQYGDSNLGSESLTIKNCAVAPQGSTSTSFEVEDRGRDGAAIGFTIYAPPGADIRHTDRHVEIAGIAGVFRVEGEPGPWHSPYTGLDRGIVADVVRGEG